MLEGALELDRRGARRNEHRRSPDEAGPPSHAAAVSARWYSRREAVRTSRTSRGVVTVSEGAPGTASSSSRARASSMSDPAAADDAFQAVAMSPDCTALTRVSAAAPAIWHALWRSAWTEARSRRRDDTSQLARGLVGALDQPAQRGGARTCQRLDVLQTRLHEIEPRQRRLHERRSTRDTSRRAGASGRAPAAGAAPSRAARAAPRAANGHDRAVAARAAHPADRRAR